VSEEEQKAKQIATLNDMFRQRFNIPFTVNDAIIPGQIVATRALMAPLPDVQVRDWETVRRFEAFNGDNDPHGEHDFGAFSIDGAPKKDFLEDRLLSRCVLHLRQRRPRRCGALLPRPHHHAGLGLLGHV
jgi:hypothetical protein